MAEKKGTFKYKFRHEGHTILVYEYRGREYEVVDSNWKWYTVPFAIQHREAQEKIDREIEIEEQHKKAREEGRIVSTDDAIADFFAALDDLDD